MATRISLVFLFIILFFTPIFAQNIGKSKDSTSFFKNTKVEGQWFLAYQHGITSTDTISALTLKRGYLTVKQKFSKTFEARFTQDITLDEEGSDAGNIEMRLKYCYLKINLPDAGFLTSPFIEFGLAHRPWLDFEERINKYRVQGSHFLDRTKVLSSADFGFMTSALLGGKLNEESLKKVGDGYPGKYGSISIGAYNGGGYYAVENNLDKIIEGRLSLRPLPNALPGLQFSYTHSYGKGNIKQQPLFQAQAAAVSFESKNFITFIQYYDGTGDCFGEMIDTLFNPSKNSGYSIFFEGIIPKTSFSVIGRYDYFSQNIYSEKKSERYIAGISYGIFNQSKILLDIDYLKRTDKTDTWMLELAVEIDF